MTDQTSVRNIQSPLDKMSASWQSVWNLLANELSLKTFLVKNLDYRGARVFWIRHGDGSQKVESVRFNAEVADISFREWMSQLTVAVTGEYRDNVAVRNQEWFKSKLPQHFDSTRPRSNDLDTNERPSPTRLVEPDVWELDAS
ncbi:unnamed protein product [Penicillium pancosmium]